MPNLHLTGPEGNRTVDLWQAQEDRDERDANLDISAFAGSNSDETFLAGLTQQHEAQVTGTATGFRLARQPDYSDDPVLALAEWVQEMMAFVNGKQGTGLTLEHDERGLTRSIIAKSFGWTRESGAKYEVSWDFAFRIGEGVMVSEEPTPREAYKQSTWALDGIDLQHPIDYREEKREQLTTAPMVFADTPEENVVKEDSAPVRTIRINGRHTGTRSERNQFDDQIRSLIGQDTIVTYESAFPGHDLDVMVNSYESTREAGLTRLGEYSLELIQGVTG
jgi:hypothetical protein